MSLRLLLLSISVWISLTDVGMREAPGQAPAGNPFGQDDPFGGNPFREQPRVKLGKEINLDVHLTDHEGKPVAEAAILLLDSKHRRRLPVFRTNQDGIARLETSEGELAEIKGTEDRMKLLVIPPKEATIPRMYRPLSIAEAKAGKPIELRTRPGIRVHGKIVGQGDRKPLNSVRLYFSAIDFTEPYNTRFMATTDQEGNWSIVIPRVDSQVVLAGSLDGYMLRHDSRYRQEIKIPEGEVDLELDDFVIEQIPSRSIVVTGEDGQPISGASTSAYYERWYTPTFPALESLASSEQTDADGHCRLILRDVDWKRGRVCVEVELDDLIYVGRAELTRDLIETVHVQVRPHGMIEGRLFEGDAPAGGVDLVLYESVDFEGVGRRTVGLRSETRTNALGRFEFPAEVETTYTIALAEREKDGKQLKLHEIEKPLSGFEYRVPDLDLSRIRADELKREESKSSGQSK